MTQVTAPQITFGKQTKMMIKSLVPTAAYFKKVGKDVVVKDANNKTVATWHNKSLKRNSLIVIW
jgi:hypothetical protein